MAKSLNICMFIGNLGDDPSVRYMPSGDPVANFSIAVADDYKDKKSGEKVEVTEWIRCVAFNRLAEIVEQYLSKGSKVFISGRMKTRSWESDGVKKYATEIVVENLQMLSPKKEADNQANQSQPSQQQSQPQNSSFDDFGDEPSF